MRAKRAALAFAAFLAVSGSIGCAGQQEEDWTQASPESQGYRWVGSGERGNFGSAYSFCRSTLGAETEGQRLQGGAGAVGALPGSPTTVPGYERSAQGRSGRADYSSRRQFWGCMESQGWAVAEPQPAMQPAPQPAPAPQPEPKRESM